MDNNGDGVISAEDLRALLGDLRSEEEIKALIEEADTSKDGKIVFQEFLTLMRAHDMAACG